MEKKTNIGCVENCDSGEKSPKSSPTMNAGDNTPVDSFYAKLMKLHESSGLSLAFNFQEATLDLHLLYKEVTKRGGFHEVIKYGKWDEIASTINSQCSVSIGPTELQTVYKNLLHQFEQIYHYRAPRDANLRPGKRKHCDSSCSSSFACFGDLEHPAEKKMTEDQSRPLSAAEQIEAMLLATDKELIKDTDPPLKPRTGYQIFLRIACHRLKKMYGESQNIRDLAIKAWRRLTEEDKLPFIHAHKMDRERYNREMAAYEHKQNLAETRSDYFVSLQPQCEVFQNSPDQCSVELANEIIKNAQANDPILQAYWDEFYGSLD